jgi:glucose uptake protein GlcU
MAKTFIKIIVAAIVAMGAACVLIAHGASDRVVFVTYICVSIIVAAILGVFHVNERKARQDVMRRRMYKRAA